MNLVIPSDTPTQTLSVSELNQQAKRLLETKLGQVWVEGEISNFSHPQSGHVYFSLKDSQAQVRCALFRMHWTRLKFTLSNGMLVRVRGQVSLYVNRGDYQLIINEVTLAGEGQLRLAFEALKNRLAQEGLFDAQYKIPLPPLPRQIGVITSPSGAAIRDILNVLKRRFAAIPVIIYPSAVQGQQAAAEIIMAIRLANQRADCDLLILARGGGSLEDLWPFNDEQLARCIFASQLPILTGIGHEIDFTIADFVADQRAPTPSAAAELAVPDSQIWLQQLQQFQKRLNQQWFNQLQHWQTQLFHLQKQLRHPLLRLQGLREQLQQLNQRLFFCSKIRQEKLQQDLYSLQTRLQQQRPQAKIQTLHSQIQQLSQRLQMQQRQHLIHAKQKLQNLARTLEAVSPLQTLQRGFAIVKTEDHIIQSVHEVRSGQEICVQMKDGEIDCHVTKVN